MLFIVSCVVCISLSSISTGKSGPIVDEPTLPVYVPILFSLTVPIAQASGVLIAKRVTNVKKVSGRDFTFAFFLVYAYVFFSYAMYSFSLNEGTFDWHYFKLGFIGSTCMITGICLVNLAVSTGKAAGPCLALVSC